MTQKKNQLKVSLNDKGRLDQFLAGQFPDWSRMFFKRLIDSGAVLVDKKTVSPNHKLKIGQVISISWPGKKKKKEAKDKTPIPFPVLFEDKHLMVINKPAGLLVHPTGTVKREETLVDILEPKISGEDWPDESRPGLVHRLDRDTSGVLVFAKSPKVHAHLSNQFAKRTINKIYFALVHGIPKVKQGTLECKMGRHSFERKKFTVRADGRMAITEFKLKEAYAKVASLLEIHPLTGRTHQIRVQLSHFKHPILGDGPYGGKKEGFEFAKRHLLHASKLEFTHPETKKKVKFEASLPEDFLEVIKIIRSNFVAPA